MSQVWREIFVVALFTVALISCAVAESLQRPADCEAAVRDKPTLDAKQLPGARFRLITETIGWERDKAGKQIELTLRHGEETAELKDGVSLRVNQGGCETYSNQYEFTLSEPENADGAYWLHKASQLLLEIAPANLDSAIPMQKLAEILAHQAGDPRATRRLLKEGLEKKLGSGVGGSTYRIEVKRQAGRVTLRVSYFIDL